MSEQSTDVFFADLRAGFKESLLKKVGRLFLQAGFSNIVMQDDLVAVKIHVGEEGCTAYVRPDFVRVIVDEITTAGARPFLAETNTLYHGLRSNSIGHLKLAALHGFTEANAGAPLIICDGLTGQNCCEVRIDQSHCQEAFIASDIARANAVVSVAHFKLHLATGFGGAIKNVAMGCASMTGKLAQHCNVRPFVDTKRCTLCGRCRDVCRYGAIRLEEKAALLNESKCAGCAECIASCPTEAIRVKWDATSRDLQERMVEYLFAVVKGKEGKMGYLNFLTNITPGCDCMPFSDAPIVPDIGILASLDPIAIDQASIDLVNRSTGFENTALKERFKSGHDKVRAVYPDIDWEVQLQYGERLGLGHRSYRLITI
ncbi:MAG: DUF362 domain-containing protein [Gemmatimonadota bacterium]|nr:MAG: DUF362 domain-containing protein [Gemmatimonadota bacterium]